MGRGRGSKAEEVISGRWTSVVGGMRDAIKKTFEDRIMFEMTLEQQWISFVYFFMANVYLLYFKI